MGYIKEPKGVDFVVEPHVLTDEDQRIMSKIIADYKATGKITRARGRKKLAVQVRKLSVDLLIIKARKTYVFGPFRVF